VGRRRRRDFNKKKRKMSSHDYEREPLLNMRHQIVFKYDLREILAETKLDDTVKTTLIASIIAKGSRQGIQEAKDYVYSMGDANEGLDEAACDRIAQLLNRYTKYR